MCCELWSSNVGEKQNSKKKEKRENSLKHLYSTSVKPLDKPQKQMCLMHYLTLCQNAILRNSTNLISLMRGTNAIYRQGQWKWRICHIIKK